MVNLFSQIMKWLIEKSRYLTMVSIFGMLAGAIASIYPGTVKTVKVLYTAFTNTDEVEPTLYILFEALDCFLIATALIVIAFAIYDLCSGELAVPDRTTIEDLTELKAKFTFVIVPVMAVKFVQKILKYDHAPDVVY